MTAPAVPEAQCSVCGEAVRLASAQRCRACHAAYHVDCWHFVGACSIFGCGETESLRGDQPAPSAAAPALVIDETTATPWAGKVVLLGWVRRLRVRARDLPITLVTGGAGGVLTWAAMGAFARAYGHLYSGDLAGQAVLAIGVGLATGLLAPFVARSHLERPKSSVLVGLFFFWLCYFRAPVNDWTFGAALVALVLTTSAGAEAVFGRRTRTAKALGFTAAWARTLASWAGMLLVLALTHPQVWVRGRMLLPVQWLELATWALLAASSGGIPMEAGKHELEKKRIAAQVPAA